MDENTKHTVASHLTVAFYASQSLSINLTEEIVFQTYNKFLSLLENKLDSNDSDT